MNVQSLEKLVSKIGDELTCQICYEPYSEESVPKTLPCLHSFCEACLRRYMKLSRNAANFDCPTCRKEIKLMRLDEVPVNEFLQQFNSSFEMGMESLLSRKRRVAYCDNCRYPSGDRCLCDCCVEQLLLAREFCGFQEDSVSKLCDEAGCLVEDLLKSCTCPVCLQLLREPVCMPCLHTCCGQCVDRNIKGRLRCPTCNREENVNTLQRNFPVDSILCILTKYRNKPGWRCFKCRKSCTVGIRLCTTCAGHFVERLNDQCVQKTKSVVHGDWQIAKLETSGLANSQNVPVNHFPTWQTVFARWVASIYGYLRELFDFGEHHENSRETSTSTGGPGVIYNIEYDNPSDSDQFINIREIYRRRKHPRRHRQLHYYTTTNPHYHRICMYKKWNRKEIIFEPDYRHCIIVISSLVISSAYVCVIVCYSASLLMF